MEALAKQDGQPLLQDSNLLVEWRPNQPFDDDDEYDDDYEPSVVGSEDDVDLEVDDPIDEELVDVDDEIGNHETTNQGLSQGGQLAIEPLTGDLTQTQLEGVGVGATHGGELDIGEDDAVHVEEEGVNTEGDEGAAHMEEEGGGQVEEEGAIDNTGEEESDTRKDEETAQWSGYNLRSNRSREYSHRFDPQVYDVTNLHVSHTPRKPVNTTQKVFGFVFTQMTTRAGIKKHGQAARDALTAEFAQLDYKGAYEPVHTTDLTESQRRGALRILNLIREKRDGRLKGRSIADGQPQCAFYTKEETSSPTVTPESVLLTALIDAVEDRHVVVADVTSAYLNADMDDFVLIHLSGEDVDMMCDANPVYADFITNDNGKKTLFLQLKKALYGCVKSALIWYAFS